ncbi:hypothetical protein DFJ77DRAFT_470675 [Powellomyces hirtus]|nr:hypothetical protein DFJ77DRAFT_470675 [Powellomyces hirtus]
MLIHSTLALAVTALVIHAAPAPSLPPTSTEPVPWPQTVTECTVGFESVTWSLLRGWDMKDYGDIPTHPAYGIVVQNACECASAISASAVDAPAFVWSAKDKRCFPKGVTVPPNEPTSQGKTSTHLRHQFTDTSYELETELEGAFEGQQFDDTKCTHIKLPADYKCSRISEYNTYQYSVQWTATNQDGMTTDRQCYLCNFDFDQTQTLGYRNIYYPASA